jgi:hypothetical protein
VVTILGDGAPQRVEVDLDWEAFEERRRQDAGEDR